MKLTLTGVDERTPIPEIVRLSQFAEVGILYSASNTGPRYPGLPWIVKALQAAYADGKDRGRVALHVCGRLARVELLTGALDVPASFCWRLQVNGFVLSNVLAAVLHRFPAKSVITQHNDDNAPIAYHGNERHQVLLDASGGRGILPGAWTIPDSLKHSTKAVGFAGGLTPANLGAELPKIVKAIEAANRTPADAWVDMESGLRTASDDFSPALAWEAVEAWNKWKA